MITFLSRVKNGKLDFGSKFNETRFKDFLKKNEGKEIKITPARVNRSMSQNRLYWVYLDLIERETGNSAMDMNEYFKRIHLKPKFIKVLRKEIRIPRSTTDLTTAEMGEYMQSISEETGIPVPDTEQFKRWIESAPDVGEVYGPLAQMFNEED